MSLTAKQVADALTATRGMVSVAARRLGCTRKTVYNYINRYATVQEALEDARESTTDVAELKLFEAINAGEPWAVQFYLKTQGKTRGYAERQEQELSGGVEVRIVRE